RKAHGEGRPLQDSFLAPTTGPVTATAHLANARLTIQGRIGETPFLRQLATPGLQPGRWSVQATSEQNQVRLTLGPPDRPPLGARILSFRGQIEQPTAQPLATGHVALTAILAMEAEWLDNQGRRRVTDWQIELKHLLHVPEATPGELLGINLGLQELTWAPDRPIWALLRAELAHYRPSFLPVSSGRAVTGWAPAPVLTGHTVADFAWTEPDHPRSAAQVQLIEIPFDRPLARLIALDLRPGALDLLLGLKGGGLHLLTVPSSWRSPPLTLTVFARHGSIQLQGQ
ncbi:MAG TPA: hypothetical protein VK191_00285, partial [Symbiobacteriaceae bacterium]|nr:hypothetical protein [Symbiobacteriaceae bacterium]